MAPDQPSDRRPAEPAHLVGAGGEDPYPMQSMEAYLLDALERLDASEMRAENLEQALDHARSIGAAIGVLMAMEKLTQAEAFDRLREASMNQNRKLYLLAQEVVERGAL
jgi:AmiR/NasT family two-component response regulator